MLVTLKYKDYEKEVLLPIVPRYEDIIVSGEKKYVVEDVILEVNSTKIIVNVLSYPEWQLK